MAKKPPLPRATTNATSNAGLPIASHSDDVGMEANVYRTLLHTLPDAFVAIDDKRRVVEWSPRAVELFGWSFADVAAGSTETLGLPLPYQKSADAELPIFVRLASPARGRRAFSQYLAINAEGTEFPVELCAINAPHQGSESASHFFLIKDIRHRLVAEERIAQAGKMEAIGQMASGLAHDFNNALGIIQGSLETLAMRLKDPLNRELVELAMAATARGTETTRAMQAVARRQPVQQARVDINKVLSDIRLLLTKSLGSGIELTVLPEAAESMVLIDTGALNNVVLNFAINARDAMPSGGMVLVYTQNIAIADDPLEAVDLAPGHYVVVGVDDSGTGMPPEVVSRAMEPFFTTKPKGKGTGLGLAMAYAFARQSGGALRIRSTPGKGTNIHLFIPVADTAVEDFGVTNHD